MKYLWRREIFANGGRRFTTCNSWPSYARSIESKFQRVVLRCQLPSEGRSHDPLFN